MVLIFTLPEGTRNVVSPLHSELESTAINLANFLYICILHSEGRFLHDGYGIAAMSLCMVSTGIKMLKQKRGSQHSEYRYGIHTSPRL